MRKFANLFFVLYLTDAVLSLLHEIFAVAFQTSATSGLRNLVASAVLLVALPLYVSLGIDRRLPKGVIIPQILFVFWMALGAWPVTSTNGSFGLLSATIQLLLGLLPFILYAGIAGSNRLLPQERFLPDFFSLRNTLLFFVTQIIFLPLIIGFVAVSVMALYVDQGTAGFMRLGRDGIHMEERVYRLSGKNIRLVGMIHIGEHDFYQTLIDSVASKRTVILAEGVTDRDGLLTSRFGYGDVAQLLGLTSQSDVPFKGRLIDETDLQKRASVDFTSSDPDIIRADTDLNQLSPKTVEFINMLGKQLSNDDSSQQGIKSYETWAKENVTPELTRVIFTDLLDSRNKVVLAWLDRVLPLYDTVVIPWGALHMPGLEAAILQRGFKPVSSHEYLSVDFSDFPFAKLLEKMSGAKAQSANKTLVPTLYGNTLNSFFEP